MQKTFIWIEVEQTSGKIFVSHNILIQRKYLTVYTSVFSNFSRGPVSVCLITGNHDVFGD